MTTPLVLAGVFGASVLGSVHCAAMCGGFACLASGTSPSGGSSAGSRGGDGPAHGGVLARRRHEGTVSYHAGRLVAYVSLGAAAGAFGAGIERAGALVGLARAASVLTGVLLVLWGMARLAPLLGRGGSPARARTGVSVSDRWARAMGRVLLALRTAPASVRAGTLGLVTALLPCGWLWAFVVTAAGTGTAGSGALTMSVFCLGTVPALVAVASGLRRASGALSARLPLVSASLVIGVGVASLAGHLVLSARPHAHDTATRGAHAPHAEAAAVHDGGR